MFCTRSILTLSALPDVFRLDPRSMSRISITSNLRIPFVPSSLLLGHPPLPRHGEGHHILVLGVGGVTAVLCWLNCDLPRRRTYSVVPMTLHEHVASVSLLSLDVCSEENAAGLRVVFRKKFVFSRLVTTSVHLVAELR